MYSRNTQSMSSYKTANSCKKIRAVSLKLTLTAESIWSSLMLSRGSLSERPPSGASCSAGWKCAGQRVPEGSGGAHGGGLAGSRPASSR